MSLGERPLLRSAIVGSSRDVVQHVEDRLAHVTLGIGQMLLEERDDLPELLTRLLGVEDRTLDRILKTERTLEERSRAGGRLITLGCQTECLELRSLSCVAHCLCESLGVLEQQASELRRPTHDLDAIQDRPADLIEDTDVIPESAPRLSDV